MIPTGRHTDWPWPLSYIPRSWTSRVAEYPPIRLFGNTELIKGNLVIWSPKPIPNPGEWHIAYPPYFAMTTRSKWHFRIGIRWDNIDGYYTLFSFKIGKIQ